MTQPFTLLHGDCLTVELPTEKPALIYADPPFGKGQNRTHARTGNGYSDNLVGHQYRAWLSARLVRWAALVKAKGWFVLQHDPLEGARLLPVLEKELGLCYGIVTWQDSWPSGFRASTQFWPRIHDSIFFWRFGRATFTQTRIPHPDNYVRRGGTSTVDRAIGDVWVGPYSPGQLSFAKKHDWPDEKPTALLARIIEATTSVGDLVCDPFCGSGTTLVAANQLGRKAIGVDNSLAAIRIAASRMRSGHAKLVIDG